MAREIKIQDPHRKKHFDFFRQMNQPHFSITAHLPVTNLLRFRKQSGEHLTTLILYCICHAANTLPKFRQRIRGDRLIEHDAIHPSFTVETEASDVFSFCYVEYQPDFQRFAKAVQDAIQHMQVTPSFEDVPGRDDYLFLSALPWVRFTGMTHAMHIGEVDSVPRIVWGRIYQTEEAWLMPLNVQAHHAIVNGVDAGQFFQQFEQSCYAPETLFGD